MKNKILQKCPVCGTEEPLIDKGMETEAQADAGKTTVLKNKALKHHHFGPLSLFAGFCSNCGVYRAYSIDDPTDTGDETVADYVITQPIKK